MTNEKVINVDAKERLNIIWITDKTNFDEIYEDNKKILVFDIECANNYFLVLFKNIHTKKLFGFEALYDKKTQIIYLNGKKTTQSVDTISFFFDYLKTFLLYVKENDVYLSGYNSSKFDIPLLDFICEREKNSIYNIYEAGQDFILGSQHIVEDLKKYYYKSTFSKHIDLMKLGRLDYHRVSLKQCGILLEHPLVQELPFSHTEAIPLDMVRVVRRYCVNDLDITEKVFNFYKSEIKIGYFIEKKKQIPNVISLSRSSKADKIFEKKYCSINDINSYDYYKIKKEWQEVKQKGFYLKEIISKNIVFESEYFKKFIEDLKVIKINPYNLGEGLPKKSYMYKNLIFNLGVGGLHSVDKSYLYVANENDLILDIDATSYYPNLIINNNVYPPNLGKSFIQILENEKNERVMYKAKKMMDDAEVGKIIINSISGKLNDINSIFFYPKGYLKMTLNGQLGLLMLAERFISNDIDVLSLNTDGITIKTTKDKEPVVTKLYKWWEKQMGIPMETAEYKLIARMNVNNYLAITTENKAKTKGMFGIETMLDKNPTVAKIVRLALYNYFTKKISIKDTILKDNNIYNFCYSQRIGKNFKLVGINYDYTNETLVKERLPNILRGYVTKDRKGCVLKKIDGNSEISFLSGKKIAFLHSSNDLKQNISDYNIDYSHYIAETNKWLDTMSLVKLSLFE